jgi:hypothetical protein
MEEKIRELQAEIKDRVRKTREVEKEHTLLEGRSSTLQAKLEQGNKELELHVKLRSQVYLVLRCVGLFFIVSFVAIHE